MNEMTPNQELEAIDQAIEINRKNVALAESLQRLLKNRDFKAVFTNHFLGSDVARVVKLMADPTQQTEASQQVLRNRLIAVGEVDQFMHSVLRIGDIARQNLEADEITREDILRECEESEGDI